MIVRGDYLKPSGEPLARSFAFDMDPAFLAGFVEVVPALRPEEVRLLPFLDFSTDSSRRVLTVKISRRLAGLVEFLHPTELRDALLAGPLSGWDPKNVTKQIVALRKRFSECVLHGYTMCFEIAAPKETKVKRTELLEKEIERLRALLEANGIDAGPKLD